MDVTPQMISYNLIKMCTKEFITNVFDTYCDSIDQFWNKYHIDLIQENHK